MRRDYPLWFAVALLGAVLLVIAMILWARGERLSAENTELREALAVATEPHEGGAETDPPPARPQSSKYTFPIAASDYLQMTSPFGYRVSPILRTERYHQGVDIAATWQAQVVSSMDGVVVQHWPPPGTPVPGKPGVIYEGHPTYGGLVVIEDDEGWQSFYAHLSWTRVHTGDRVRAGEVIGRIGNSGQSVGYHLHYELVMPDGTRANPLLYVMPGVTE